MKKRNIKYFSTELNRLCNELDMQYNINSGYCYYVAYLIAKFCEKNNIDYDFARYSMPWHNDDCFHYGVRINNIIVNPDSEEPSYYQLEYVGGDSKWMYQQHKENYHPELSHYWKDYNRRYVNSELKWFFSTFEKLWQSNTHKD